MTMSKVSEAIIIVVILTVYVIVTNVSSVAKSEDKELKIIEKAHDFELINQNNQEISLNQFIGKIKVITFMYTSCNMPNMCPLTTVNLRSLQESLEDEYGKNVVLLTITFDPESDTPGMLEKYGQLYGVNFNNWHFLTGSKQDIDKVSNDYGIIHERQEDGTIRHSMIAFLVDQNDNVRKMYFANKWKPEDIKKDIITLLGGEK